MPIPFPSSQAPFSAVTSPVLSCPPQPCSERADRVRVLQDEEVGHGAAVRAVPSGCARRLHGAPPLHCELVRKCVNRLLVSFLVHV